MTAIPAETQAEIEKLVRKHGENPEGRYFVPLANAYRRSGSVSAAIAVLRKGIRRHPDYLSARIVLGHCYSDQGEVDAARSEFQHVLSFDPHNLVALRSLGELAVAAGNDDEARSRYEQLLAVDPMNEEARAGLQILSHGSALAGFGHSTGLAADEDDAPGGGDVIPSFPRAEAPAFPESTAATAAAADPSGELAIPGAGFPPAEPSDAEVGVPAVDGGDYDGEEIVVTETIAELYTRQGFFNRAAHVYRELLRRHGEDPRLRDRLNRVERLALGEVSPVATPAAAPARPTVEAGRGEVLPPAPTADPGGFAVAGSDAAHDPFADSFAAGFPRVGIDDVEIVAVRGEARGATDIDITVSPVDPPAMEASGPVAAAIEPPAAPASESGRIGDYLLGVLDWSGRPPREHAPADPDAPMPSAPPAAVGPGKAERPPLPAAAASLEGVAPLKVDGPARPAGDDLFPWEIPDAAGSAPTTQAAGPPTSAEASSPFSFDEAARSSEPPDRDGVATVPPASSGPATPAASATAAEADDDDDDDIESFQAWLRSLKR